MHSAGFFGFIKSAPMEIEAMFFRLGQLRREDVRAALAERYFKINELDVLVLGAAGELGASCTVHLGWSPGGRGKHRMILCPRCLAPKRVLLTDGSGSLACAQCLHHRTRRQRERHTADFRRLGGLAEDRLLRAATRPHPAVARLEELARELLEQDRARARLAILKASAAAGSLGRRL